MHLSDISLGCMDIHFYISKEYPKPGIVEISKQRQKSGGIKEKKICATYEAMSY